jgi:transcription elongation GreA/GreB family factor
VRRRRPSEAAAPEGTAPPLPSSAGAPPANLFKMDYSTTRIWRNSESALVLAGRQTPCPAEPLALVEVLAAATSEIAECGRVMLDVQQGVRVSRSAVTDTVNLLAELLENATSFSPETTAVNVSGHALCGGGSLITITDGGTGMSEEELTLVNWQLANPSLTDMAATSHMGLFGVALLAARHGITVTLSMPPDGGTTAEVYLPDALITLDGPEPPPGRETDAREAIPVMLGAPVPSPAPGTTSEVTEPGRLDAQPGGEPAIFESVRSGYLYAFGREPLPFSEEQAGESPTGQPARPSASPPASPSASEDAGHGRAVAEARRQASQR